MTFGDFQFSGPRGNNLTATIAVLPSLDIAASKRLYESLGFACVIASPNADYLIIRRDWVELHFWLFTGLVPNSNTVSAYLRVGNVDTASMSFLLNGLTPEGCRYTAPSNKPWGMREAHFIDHDGNLLTIGTPHDRSRWLEKI